MDCTVMDLSVLKEALVHAIDVIDAITTRPKYQYAGLTLPSVGYLGMPLTPDRTRRRWSQWEIDKAKNGAYTDEEVAAQTGRKISAVKRFRKTLKLFAGRV